MLVTCADMLVLSSAAESGLGTRLMPVTWNVMNFMVWLNLHCVAAETSWCPPVGKGGTVLKEYNVFHKIPAI